MLVTRGISFIWPISKPTVGLSNSRKATATLLLRNPTTVYSRAESQNTPGPLSPTIKPLGKMRNEGAASFRRVTNIPTVSGEKPRFPASKMTEHFPNSPEMWTCPRSSSPRSVLCVSLIPGRRRWMPSRFPRCPSTLTAVMKLCPSSRPRSISMPMTLLVMKSCRSSPRTSMLPATPSRGGPASVTGRSCCWARCSLGCNCDYDKLQNLAEEHRSLRRIMGIGTWDDHDPMPWDWRRIRDNLCLVHPETLAKINERVVRVGHRLGPTAAEKVRGDTFVVKTNIHYPTDANLLADGLRKILHLGGAVGVAAESGRLASRKPISANVSSAWSGPSTRPASRRKAIWQGGGGVPIGRC